MDAPTNEHYLGDGLSVRLDRYGMVILSCERDGIAHWVALEPVVLGRFERWVKSQRKTGGLP